MSFVAINPTTGERVREVPLQPAREVRDAIKSAHQAFGPWRRLPFAERAARLRSIADRLRADDFEHAQTMAIEMGKPITAGRAEVEKCAWVCEYYAKHAETFLADEPAAVDDARAYVTYEPLGVVLAIMPWNFPYWQVLRFAAPAVMAGNAVLLKHAPNVPECAERLTRLFLQAGCPAGVFQHLVIDEKQVKTVIRNKLVRAVTLTGSVRAGKAVARQAGAHLKKTVLELGGSDPYLVLEDADLDLAAEQCVTSRLINSGQSCIAAKRFIVVNAVREAFEERVVERMRSARVGNPLAPDTDVGPMARADLRDTLHQQVEDTLAAGARCLLGGSRPDGPGFFYPPTVLTDVPASAPAAREELFGPVAAILPVTTRRRAIAVANRTTFGLGAAVFTGDRQSGEDIARRDLEAGSCFVNALVRSDPRLPFGGIKDSGYGRELARHGIREFVNVKTVWVT